MDPMGMGKSFECPSKQWCNTSCDPPASRFRVVSSTGGKIPNVDRIHPTVSYDIPLGIGSFVGKSIPPSRIPYKWHLK